MAASVGGIPQMSASNCEQSAVVAPEGGDPRGSKDRRVASRAGSGRPRFSTHSDHHAVSLPPEARYETRVSLYTADGGKLQAEARP